MIAEEFALPKIAPDEQANDIGMDSLQAVNAALRIEKQFAVSIAPELLLSDRSLGSIVAEIAAQALQR